VDIESCANNNLITGNLWFNDLTVDEKLHLSVRQLNGNKTTRRDNFYAIAVILKEIWTGVPVFAKQMVI